MSAAARGKGPSKEEFDRRLAAEKAKWQAEAWERGLIQGRAASIDGVDLDLIPNPYRGSDDDR